MNYSHIHRTEKFTEPYISFINKHFNSMNHEFMVLEQERGENIKSEYKNVHYINNNVFGYIRILLSLYKADRIYLHSLINIKVVLLLYLNPWLLRKCTWIVWGYDLYSYRKPKNTIRKKIAERIRKRVIKNINEILPIVEGDYKLAQKWYGTKAKHRYNAHYVTNLEVINNIDFSQIQHNSKKTRILLGNSATATNRHEEALQILSKFKNQSIEIYCPLSYGNFNYANKIISKGKHIFGEKFIPLTEFIDMEDYIKLISTMDIGIFNNDRQQAMGNIYLLLYFGKKLYLRKDTSMWEELNNKYYINHMNEVGEVSLCELHRQKNSNRLHNIKVASDRYDREKVIEHWKKIFGND